MDQTGKLISFSISDSSYGPRCISGKVRKYPLDTCPLTLASRRDLTSYRTAGPSNARARDARPDVILKTETIARAATTKSARFAAPSAVRGTKV